MSVTTPTARRRIRRTRLYRQIDRQLMERRKSEERLRGDMRRYLRNLLRRKGPQEENEFCLLWSSRPQFRKHNFIEIDKIIKSCIPEGWKVQKADARLGDEFTGWIFVRPAIQTP